MKTDPTRAEPWNSKNSMLIRKVRYVFGFGCWCCGYETEWVSPWKVQDRFPKWCMYCKYGMCSVCGNGGEGFPSFRDRLISVLTPDK